MKESRWPKYKTLPLALAIYLLVMAVYGWKTTYPENPKQYWLVIAVEAVIIVILYFLLKYSDKCRRRRNGEDSK